MNLGLLCFFKLFTIQTHDQSRIDNECVKHNYILLKEHKIWGKNLHGIISKFRKNCISHEFAMGFHFGHIHVGGSWKYVYFMYNLYKLNYSMFAILNCSSFMVNLLILNMISLYWNKLSAQRKIQHICTVLNYVQNEMNTLEL